MKSPVALTLALSLALSASAQDALPDWLDNTVRDFRAHGRQTGGWRGAIGNWRGERLSRRTAGLSDPKERELVLATRKRWLEQK